MKIRQTTKLYVKYSFVSRIITIFADEKCNNVTKKVCWHGDKKRKISKTAYRKEEG